MFVIRRPSSTRSSRCTSSPSTLRPAATREEECPRGCVQSASLQPGSALSSSSADGEHVCGGMEPAFDIGPRHLDRRLGVAATELRQAHGRRYVQHLQRGEPTELLQRVSITGRRNGDASRAGRASPDAARPPSPDGAPNRRAGFCADPGGEVRGRRRGDLPAGLREQRARRDRGRQGRGLRALRGPVGPLPARGRSPDLARARRSTRSATCGPSRTRVARVPARRTSETPVETPA